MKRRALLSIAALGAVFELAAACSDSPSSSNTPAQDANVAADVVTKTDASDAAPACTLKEPYSTKDLDCNACAEEHCCEVINACLNEKDCNDGYVNCIIACALSDYDAGPDGGDAGDPTKPCKDQCEADYPTGGPLYRAFSKCTDTTCAVPCK